jgi:hypothetical protein
VTVGWLDELAMEDEGGTTISFQSVKKEVCWCCSECLTEFQGCVVEIGQGIGQGRRGNEINSYGGLTG